MPARRHVTRHLVAALALGTLALASCGSDDANGDGTAVTTAVPYRVLREGFEGPVVAPVTEDSLPGVDNRRLTAHVSGAALRAELAATVWSDGADHADIAQVLDDEGGTVLTLYLGTQGSTGLMRPETLGVRREDDALIVDVRIVTEGNCPAAGALSSPFQFVHVMARAATVRFVERIVPCVRRDRSRLDPIGRTP